MMKKMECFVIKLYLISYSTTKYTNYSVQNYLILNSKLKFCVQHIYYINNTTINFFFHVKIYLHLFSSYFKFQGLKCHIEIFVIYICIIFT